MAKVALPDAGPLWRKAMPQTNGLEGMAGKKASDAATILRKAIVAMETDPDTYLHLSPTKNQVHFFRQLELLRSLHIWCTNHPDATILKWF